MSAAVRRAYAGMCLIERDGVWELRESGALLARTDHPAMADKLFFKRALEISCGVVEQSGNARVWLTADGKRAFGCEGERSLPPSKPVALPPPSSEGGEGNDTSSVTADAVPPFLAAARSTRGSDRPPDGHSLPRDAASLPQGEGTSEEKPKRKVFKKPTVEEIANYCRERGDTLTDPQEFYDYYESVGWMVAGAEMNNWREMVSLWFIREWDKKRERSEAG